MKKTVTMCTRVEGHGSINYFLQQNEITGVNFEVQAIRGFENILLNKKLVDVPRIASRICGLCYGAQTIASCKAIESMFDIQPSEQSIQVRRLLMIGELINSHSMHVFFQALPDLFVVLKKQADFLALGELLRFDPQLTSNVMELIRIGKEIVGIVGGRSAHPITPTIGGVLQAPSKKAIGIMRKSLQKAQSTITWIIERYQELISRSEPPEDYSLANSAFLAMHNNRKYERYDGALRMNYDGALLTEFSGDKYPMFMDRDRTVTGIYAHMKGEGDYKLFVGPLARYHIIENYGGSELESQIESYLKDFSEPWHNNLFFSNILRLIEIMVEINQGLVILDDVNLTKPVELPPLNSIKNEEGMGVVEAPRGTLIHHYHVSNKMVLDRVKLLVATEINIPTINDILTKQSQKLYAKVQDLEQVKRQAQMIVRSFDPCISCATH